MRSLNSSLEKAQILFIYLSAIRVTFDLLLLLTPLLALS